MVSSGTKTVVKILSFLIIISLLFFVGEFAQRFYFYSLEPHLDNSRRVAALMHIRDNAKYRLTKPFSENILRANGVQVHELLMKRKDVEHLKNTAETVLSRGTSAGIVRDYMPAKFMHDDRWIDVNVKLRGLYWSHYLVEHPSLRIKFPRNHYYHGKRYLNLIEPYDKELTGDATTLWELSRHGLMALDNRFVGLKINGELVGIYQEIEFFDQSLTDRNGRPEGVIVSGTGEIYGNDSAVSRRAIKVFEVFHNCTYESEYPPDPGVCNWEYVRENFDTDKLAWAFAMTTLLGSHHAWFDLNLRLFFDPVRGKFEPIPWDYYSFPLEIDEFPKGERAASTGMQWILDIPEFRRMRNERLWILLNERLEPMNKYADDLFLHLEKIFSGGSAFSRSRLWAPTWDPSLHHKYISELNSNASILKELFEKNEMLVEQERPGNDPGREAPGLPGLPNGVRVEGENVIFGPGEVVVSANIYLPQSYNVTFKRGLVLAIHKDASIIIRGNLTGIAEADTPIIIKGYGDTISRGSVVVQGEANSRSRVILEYVNIEGGTGGEYAGKLYSASLLLIDADVTIRACSFYGSEIEDAVNIVYSDVSIENSVFRNSASDALDLDFCTGTVSGNVFADTRGDALDLSGSDISIENNEIVGCGDKGISVGEKTEVTVRNTDISNCVYGIAVKDGSVADIKNTTFRNLDAAIALYRKKATFGFPEAVMSGSCVMDVETLYVKSPFSKLILEDIVRIEDEEKKLSTIDGVRNIQTGADKRDTSFLKFAD